jgi:hypothetical protein
MFRRLRGTAADQPSAPASPPAVPDATGGPPCPAPGCGRSQSVRCDYRDRHGYRCQTSWCPDHVEVMGQWRLCRRHAGLCRALTAGELREALPTPDLDNRAPSLVSYVADAIGPRVVALLREVAAPTGWEQVSEDPLTLTMTGRDRRAWTRVWTLHDNTGPLLRLVAEVDEERDPQCDIRLNGRLITRFVPPWIAARSTAPWLAGEATDRAGFFTALAEEQIRPAVLVEDRWVRVLDQSRVLTRA